MILHNFKHTGYPPPRQSGPSPLFRGGGLVATGPRKRACKPASGSGGLQAPNPPGVDGRRIRAVAIPARGDQFWANV